MLFKLDKKVNFDNFSRDKYNLTFDRLGDVLRIKFPREDSWVHIDDESALYSDNVLNLVRLSAEKPLKCETINVVHRHHRAHEITVTCENDKGAWIDMTYMNGTTYIHELYRKCYGYQSTTNLSIMKEIAQNGVTIDDTHFFPSVIKTARVEKEHSLHIKEYHVTLKTFWVTYELIFVENVETGEQYLHVY